MPTNRLDSRRKRLRSKRHPRRTGRLEVTRLFAEPLEDRRMLSVVNWTGVGSNALWSNAANWSGNHVPGTTDDVVINAVDSPTITVDSSAGNVTVHSLTTNDPLSITGGSLTVTSSSTLSDGLSMTAGSLVATGSGTTFAVSGPTTVSGGGASLFASAGATLSLPNLTGYSNPNTFGSATFQASGAGSTLNLAGLSTITGSGQNVVFVKVLAGGHISLPALTTISGGNVRISADATGSQVDVSALTSFNSGGNALAVTNSGSVLDASLVTLNGVDVTSTARAPRYGPVGHAHRRLHHGDARNLLTPRADQRQQFQHHHLGGCHAKSAQPDRLLEPEHVRQRDVPGLRSRQHTQPGRPVDDHGEWPERRLCKGFSRRAHLTAGLDHDQRR